MCEPRSAPGAFYSIISPCKIITHVVYYNQQISHDRNAVSIWPPTYFSFFGWEWPLILFWSASDKVKP